MIIDRMKKLIQILNDASCKYYSADSEETPLTDVQYDKYLAELTKLEDKTGIHLYDSPVNKIGHEEVEGRVKHYTIIRSLKDTKNIDDLLHFIGDKEALLSWKLDGISIVLYYQHGMLIRALSRGDGLWGKDITRNVLQMRNVPKEIDIKSNLIVRGEGCLSLNEFEQINQTIEGERFSNPRNLASGLINAPKTSSILLRHLTFIAHSVILIEGYGHALKTRHEQLDYLLFKGFKIVDYMPVVNYTLKKEIDEFTQKVQTYEYPVDGLVLALDDIKYGESLGVTARFPKHSMAFKWPDTSAMTKVTGMKWSVSKTGLITPVVLVEPVELEGTVVRRANLHNLKRFNDLQIGIGDILRIYKANKIIPEVDDNLTRSNTEKYPECCPDCGHTTVIVRTDKTEKLYCEGCSH